MNGYDDYDELNVPLGPPAPSGGESDTPHTTAGPAGRWELPGPRQSGSYSQSGPYGQGGPYGQDGPYAGSGPYAAPSQAAPGWRRPSRAAGVLAAGLLVAASAGAVIGHVAWQGGSGTAAGIAANPSTGNGSLGGSIGSGSIGSGSVGSGDTPSSGATSNGAPADTSSLAAKADAGLVDINTGLSYEDGAAAGTGMVLTSNGEVLTNNHVIDGETSISVTDVGNGKTYKANVVGYDRSADVAVLQLVDASGLQTISTGNSSTVAVGQGVVGVGNAEGAGGTPSFAGGSVTALKKSITASDSSSDFSEKLTGLIEDNVDIEPGDSGGALVNTAGQVIGMNTAAMTNSGFGVYGTSGTEAFAIPINTALKVAKEIVGGDASTTVHIGATPFLGVEIEPTGSSVGGNSFGGFGGFGSSGTTTSGALVSGLVASGPAAQAGLVAGDTITDLDGQAVTSTTLTNAILKEKPGSAVSLTYVDESGASHTVTVHLASGPPQ